MSRLWAEWVKSVLLSSGDHKCSFEGLGILLTLRLSATVPISMCGVQATALSGRWLKNCKYLLPHTTPCTLLASAPALGRAMTHAMTQRDGLHGVRLACAQRAWHPNQCSGHQSKCCTANHYFLEPRNLRHK